MSDRTLWIVLALLLLGGAIAAALFGNGSGSCGTGIATWDC